MNNKKIQTSVAIFTFLLCGTAFGGAVTDGKNTPRAVFSAVISFFAVLILALLYKKLYSKTDKLKMPHFPEVLLCASGAILLCIICAFYTDSLSKDLPLISREFRGGRFSQFFVILSLMLAVYLGKRRFTSFSRICLIMLPLILLPYIVSLFAFIGYSSPGFALKADFSPIPDPRFLIRGFSICAEVFAVFIMSDITEKSSRENKRGLFFAFAVFSVFVVFESTKYLIFFGSDGVSEIFRPDRTLLSIVPYVNVQEMFLFSYYFSYMLRICVLCTAARILFERAFVATAKGKAPDVIGYAAAPLLSYGLYLLLVNFKNFFHGFITLPFFQVLFVAGIFLYQTIKLIFGTKKPNMRANK